MIRETGGQLCHLSIVSYTELQSQLLAPDKSKWHQSPAVDYYHLKNR